MRLLAMLADYETNGFNHSSVAYRAGCDVLRFYRDYHTQADYELGRLDRRIAAATSEVDESDAGGCIEVSRAEI